MSDAGGYAERLRLAFFAPLPPAPSGVADYVADLLPLLPEEWQIDVFGPEPPGRPDEPADPGHRESEVPAGAARARAGAGARALPHTAWRAEHERQPYDLSVYHVGNNVLHAYAIPYVTETPGLLVLHDPVLHPARVEHHTRADDLAGYRAAALAARPDIGATLAELVSSGLGGYDLYWSLPLCEDLVRASRLTVVHGEGTAGWLSALVPDARVGQVVHWQATGTADEQRVEAWRARLGVDGETPLIGTFGHIGPAHGVDLLVDVLGEVAVEHAFRLVVVGAVDATLDLPARIADAGLEERVELLGRVCAEDFSALMGATDLAVNLRYPTARASSGTLQQLMQLGVPALVHDLLHTRDIPDDAVLRVPPGPRHEERRVLRQRLREWLADPEKRRRASSACVRWASRAITPEAMATSYRAAVRRAIDVQESA